MRTNDYTTRAHLRVPALVFPPLRGRQRYLIHRLVQEQYPDLATVSVGVEPHRRTTVYPHWAAPQDACSGTELTLKNCMQPLKPGTEQDKKKASLEKNIELLNKEAVPHIRCTMPGDVETPSQPPPAHARPQRRGKIAVEIYKPPAARQQRQIQPPSVSRQPQRSPHQKPTQPLYSRPNNCSTSSQQPITQAAGSGVLAVQQPPPPPESVTSPPEQTPSRTTPTCQRLSNSQLKPHCPSPPLLRGQNTTGRSPRSSRRHPCVEGRPTADRASCPPDLAHSSTVDCEKPPASAPPHSASTGNASSSSPAEQNTEVRNTEGLQTCPPQAPINPVLRVPSALDDSNASVAISDTKNVVLDVKPQLTPLMPTTAPLANNSINGPTDSLSSGKSADLRDYLNNKRQIEDQQIKSLSQTVDMLSNKYFNSTACPYNRVHNNTTNDKFSQCRSSMNSRLSNMYESYSPRNCAEPRYAFDDRQGSEYRRARPDQVLYVPRARRQHAASETGDMNHFNASRTPPLTEHYQNCRPPSPAFSITSVVSEFSGRQRYEGGYGQNVSRPSSRLSIYDGEDDKLDGKPPHTGDRRNNYCRESTPGYGKPGAARFNRQTLQLIERCINQDPKRPSSNSGDVGDQNDLCRSQEYYYSQVNSTAEQCRDGHFDRASKSPTPNRDSIHSKENVMHPIESSPRRRRSRKNRKRRSQSRDHSFDCINKETGSLGNLYHGGVSEQTQPRSRVAQRPLVDKGYTFYNSSIGRGEGPSTRGSSRNTSQERSLHEDWRQQKAVSHPGTPVKTPYHSSSPNNRTCYPSPQTSTNCNDSYSSPSVVDHLYPQTTFTHRRNSVDKPPTGRPSCDSRRNSIGKVSSPTSPPATSPTHVSPTSNVFYVNNSSQSPTNANERSSANRSVESPSTASVGHLELAAPCLDTSAQFSVLSVNEQVEGSADTNTDTPSPPALSPTSADDCIEPNASELSPVDDISLEYISLDWAAESEKEDLRLRALNGYGTNLLTTEDRTDYETSSTAFCNQNVSASSQSYVDNSTKTAIHTSIGREATLERTRHDYSKFSSSPPQRQVYRPPYERFSPPRRINPSSPGRNSPPTTRPTLNTSSSGSNSPSSGSNSPSTEHTFYGGDGAPATPPSGLAHVLELYDFPSTLRTQDLVAAYQGYQSVAPLDIKWVDDTHALAVFSTSAVAAQALSQPHALIKARLLADASPASKSKAARIDEALLPARPRPQTSMMLARRLLSGALGVRVNLTKEEREREAKTIRQAKDHKRQVAKQKEDVWEGNI